MEKQPKIYYSSWFPLYCRGIMIPHVGIIIRTKYKGNQQLIEHEKIHWKQYKRMGSLLFLFRYIFQFIFIGYDTMPLELEARQHEPEFFNYREKYFK